MTRTVQTILEKMIALYSGDPKRIQHFTKVHAYAALIGRQEGLAPAAQETLEAAALTHDIGIHACEEKYGQCGGRLQEQEGPALAGSLLREAGLPDEQTRRACFLIGHHHTYTGVDGDDWQILLEADFCVNAYEDDLSPEAVQAALDKWFRTGSGTRLCREMFGISGSDSPEISR